MLLLTFSFHYFQRLSKDEYLILMYCIVISYEKQWHLHHKHQSLVWHADDPHLNIWKLNLNLWIFGLLACQFQYSFIFTVWKKSMNNLANIVFCVLSKKSDSIEITWEWVMKYFFLFLGELPLNTVPRTSVRFFTSIYMLLSYHTKAKHSRNPAF